MPTSKLEPLSPRAGYVLALAVTALATGLNTLLFPYVETPNLVMVYLLGVTYVSSRCPPGPAILSSFLGVAAFDFVFVHPSGTFAVADIQYLFTFAAMLVVSLLICTLTYRLREQAKGRSDANFQAQVEKTRSDLLSSVSHDLRTPIAAIDGSASALLQQADLSEQSRQLATTIQTESLRMSRLIRNLLDMTRVQGSVALELDWYGLDELATNAILRTEDQFEKPVRLVVHPPSAIEKVDGVLMEQVLVNLLENAARHAGPAAQVQIEIDRLNDRFQIAVEDNGPGIPKGDEEKLFERFHRSQVGGAGLGLAICRAAVLAHQGRIWAHNRRDGGARFVIELPSVEETIR